jgi:ribosome-associated heat shock protein Hsp15
MTPADLRGDHADDGRIRFDKWLWAARFYKTRSLCVQAIDAGQVRVNGDRAKPARMVLQEQQISR